mgnify:CR=1 FL=1
MGRKLIVVCNCAILDDTFINLHRLSTTEHIDHMQHWESPAIYAKYLVELLRNDGV